MKKQYAIVGGYGVGKTHLLKRIEQLGYQVLEADSFFRVCYLKNQPCYDVIKQNLGQNFVNDTEVDRNQLRILIREDFDNKNIIEKLVYPFLEQELAHKKYDFVEIANISSQNANFKSYFDQIFELVADEKTIVENLKKKNVENSVSSLNLLLNQSILKEKNVIIYADKLKKTEQLKTFLEALK